MLLDVFNSTLLLQKIWRSKKFCKENKRALCESSVIEWNCSTVTKKRVLDSTTNLKHLMDLHRVESSANPESNHNLDLLSLLLITIFSHTFSDLHTDTTYTHKNPSMWSQNPELTPLFTKYPASTSFLFYQYVHQKSKKYSAKDCAPKTNRSSYLSMHLPEHQPPSKLHLSTASTLNFDLTLTRFRS